MQIWLFFQAGAGGDGVANLLERSKNVTPLDGETGYWRIHRIVDGSVKFYAPTIDKFDCFRHNKAFDQSINQLDNRYVDIVNQDFNCVITSHDVSLNLLVNSDCQNILCKNQIKVLLTSNNTDIDAFKGATKNLLPTVCSQTSIDYCPEQFDYVLDVDLVKTDWNYVDRFCKDIGLELDHREYLQYCDLLKGSRTFMANNFNVEEWVSTVNGTHITYKLVNTWQPTKVDQ
jgi:hypothetical protein